MGRIKWTWGWITGKNSLSPHAFWGALLTPFIVAATATALEFKDVLAVELFRKQKKAQIETGAPFSVPVSISARESRGGFLLSFERPTESPGRTVVKVSFDIGSGWLTAKAPTESDGEMRYFLSGKDVPGELIEQRMIHGKIKLVYSDGSADSFATRAIDLVRLE